MPRKKVKTKVKPKVKKFSIMLSEKETTMLTRYAKGNHCTRPVAIKRIVKAALKNYSSLPHEEVSKNQLNLFDINDQTNLLDHIVEKTKKQ